MKLSTIDTWHQLIQNRRLDDLEQLLSEDVVFYSPIVHKPLKGKAITTQYLSAAFIVLLNNTFHYVREIIDEHNAALEFEVELDGITVNGSLT